jgi:hypothetical protein
MIPKFFRHLFPKPAPKHIRFRYNDANHQSCMLHHILALLGGCRKGSARIKVNCKSCDLWQNEFLAVLPTHVFGIDACSDDVVVEAILYSDDYWASLSHSIDYTLIKAEERNSSTVLPLERCEEFRLILELVKGHDCRGNSSEFSLRSSSKFTIHLLPIIPFKCAIFPNYASRLYNDAARMGCPPIVECSSEAKRERSAAYRFQLERSDAVWRWQMEATTNPPQTKPRRG